MQDETTFTPNQTAPIPAGTTQEKVTTESTSSGPTQPSETMIGGVSGRFKIVYALTQGAILLPVLYMVALICGRTIDPTVFLSIYGAYLGVAAIGIGTYIGAQAQKPKA